MIALEILVGLALLSLGRKLFWLFVSGVGFASGALLATAVLRQQAMWVVILVALGAGLLGALLAVVIQRWAVGMASFLAGGYVAVALTRMWNLDLGVPDWLLYAGGGVVGSVLVGLLFDWALIVVSSVSGATLVTQALDLGWAVSLAILVVLAVAGILADRGREKGSVGSVKPFPGARFLELELQARYHPSGQDTPAVRRADRHGADRRGTSLCKETNREDTCRMY